MTWPLKYAQGVKREKRIEPNLFFKDINTGKILPKNFETSQPTLNGLLVFVITKQTVLIQSVDLKHCSLLSLYLARNL